VRRSDIWLVNLGPPVSSEIQKSRLLKKQGEVANTTLLEVLEVMQTLFTY